MLSKLLKYDLKWIYKVVFVFYILAFVFSIIGRSLSEIKDSLVFSITAKIIIGIAISMVVSSLINCIMRLWARFVLNIYKDESYLTHTLPVSKSTIFNSKFISTLVCIFTTMIVAVICIFICYYSESNIEALKTVLELAASTYNTTVVKLLLLIAFVILLEVLYIVLVGYVGIILGYRSNKDKMLKTLIYAFSIYFIMQVLTLAIIFGVGLFNSDIMNLFNTTNMVNVEVIKSVMYIAIAIYIAYIVILYLLGNKLLKKGVNVD